MKLATLRSSSTTRMRTDTRLLQPSKTSQEDRRTGEIWHEKKRQGPSTSGLRSRSPPRLRARQLVAHRLADRLEVACVPSADRACAAGRRRSARPARRCGSRRPACSTATPRSQPGLRRDETTTRSQPGMPAALLETTRSGISGPFPRFTRVARRRPIARVRARGDEGIASSPVRIGSPIGSSNQAAPIRTPPPTIRYSVTQPLGVSSRNVKIDRPAKPWTSPWR